MHELLPALSGFLLGAFLGTIRPALRLMIGPLAIVALGAAITQASGELKISAVFILIDILLVAVGAAVGFLAIHRLMGATGVHGSALPSQPTKRDGGAA